MTEEKEVCENVGIILYKIPNKKYEYVVEATVILTSSSCLSRSRAHPLTESNAMPKSSWKYISGRVFFFAPRSSPASPCLGIHPSLSSEDLHDPIAPCADDPSPILAPDHGAHTLTPHQTMAGDLLGAASRFKTPEPEACVVPG